MGKIIKPYDEENNFGTFASRMNNNEIVNMGGNGRSVGVRSLSSTVMGDGVDTGGNGANVVTPSDTLETETGTTGTGTGTTGTGTTGTGTGITIAPITSSPLITGDKTDMDTWIKENGGGAITAPTIQGIPSYSGSSQTYEEWMAAGGYDPDGDFAKAKSELEYDYMQNMSKFGESAERLSQMGLSGSGVSDIYQLGAYNSYLQAQKDLAAKNIEAKKQYRKEYNAYFESQQQALKTDIANAHNLGLQYYDGTNADYVRQMLTSQGYSSEAVEGAMGILATYDIDSLPTIKQRLADERSWEEYSKSWDANFKIDVNNAHNLGLQYFDGDNKDYVTQILRNAGYTEEVIRNAIDKLIAYNTDDLPTVKANAALYNTANSTIFDYYDPEDTTSKQRITNKLLAEGIPQSIIDEAFATYDAEDYEISNLPTVANRLAKEETDKNYIYDYIRKNYTGKDGAGSVASITSSLVAEGYDESVVNDAFDALVYNTDESGNKVLKSEDELLSSGFTAYVTVENEAFALYSELLELDALENYNGEEADKTYLKGLYPNVSDAVWEKVFSLAQGNYDYAQNEFIQANINRVFDAFDGTNEADIRTALANENLDQDTIDKLIKAALYDSDEKYKDASGTTAYKAKQMRVNELFDYYSESYNPDNREVLESTLIARGEDEAVAKKLFDKLDEWYNSLPKNQRPGYSSIETTVGEIQATFLADGNTYTGTPEQNASINAMLKNAGMSDKYDEVVEMLANETVKFVREKMIEGTASFSDIVGAYNVAKDNRPSEEPDEGYRDEYIQTLAATLVDNMLNNIDSLNNAYTFCNYSATNWSQLDEGDKLMAVLKTAGELKKKGVLGSGTVSEWVNAWAEMQTHFIQTKSDLQAFEEQLKTFKSEGYISEESYKSYYTNARFAYWSILN